MSWSTGRSQRPPEARPSRPPRTFGGCLTRMHVVRLLAPPLEGEDHSKDIDFSPSGIRRRWDAGYSDTQRVLAQAPWRGAFDPLEGFILHEAAGGVMTHETPRVGGPVDAVTEGSETVVRAGDEGWLSSAANYGAWPIALPERRAPDA